MAKNSPKNSLLWQTYLSTMHFGTAHRAHCSTVGITDYVKTSCVGYLMGKELKYLGNAVEDPARPFVCILGGAKVADKLSVIENLLSKADTLIIGGGMAYTFLKAQGNNVGQSLVDDSKLDYCKEMLKQAEAKGVKLLLPVDSVMAKLSGSDRCSDRNESLRSYRYGSGLDGSRHRSGYC